MTVCVHYYMSCACNNTIMITDDILINVVTVLFERIPDGHVHSIVVVYI